MTIVTMTISLLGLMITAVNVWTQAERQVGNLYDQMVRYRTEHPEVMYLSRKWQADCFYKIYNQTNEHDKSWVIYYSYSELCIGYCNAVLSSRWRLPPGSYRNQHQPLVKLTLTEHNIIIEQLVRGDYISGQVKRFRLKLRKEGWDWQEEHRKIAM